VSSLLVRWLINALALLALPYLLPGIHVDGFGAAVLAAFVLGLINALVKPVLFLLTLPATLLTLGLFILVLNGLLFWFATAFVSGLRVDGFWWAVLGAFLYSLICWAGSAVVFGQRGRIEFLK
jgi:putative membrane protein